MILWPAVAEELLRGGSLGHLCGLCQFFLSFGFNRVDDRCVGAEFLHLHLFFDILIRNHDPMRTVFGGALA